MDDLRSIFTRQLCRSVVLGALGCLVHLQVSALENMPRALDQFNTWSNGNVVSSRYAHQAASGAIKHAQSSAIAGMAAVNGVMLNKPVSINTKNGIVSFMASQRFSARSIGRALAGGPLGVALLAAPAVLALLDDAGLSVSDGEIRLPPATGPESWSPLPVFSGEGMLGLPTAGCSLAWANPGYCISGSLVIGYVPTATKNALEAAGWNYQSNQGSWHRLFRSIAGVTMTLGDGLVATPQQIEDAIAQTNPSPEALRDIVEKTGRVPTPDPADPTSLSNPQPSPEKTTTKTNPDGSTEETKCQSLGILQGIDIRMVEECTTTMKDPAGNTTSTSSTTSDDADPKPEQEEKSAFCELFPNTLACAELGTPSGDEIPRSERSVSFEAEILFGSGSCPADVPMLVNGVSIPVAQWSTWCPHITDYVRPMVILLAGFAALMIVARGTE